MMAAKHVTPKQEHHKQQDLCQTRAPYRQGRKLTAVKVYTVNDESPHLIICGVPKLQLATDVKKLVTPYGSTKKIASIPDYPSEEFTEAFHIHYERIQSARVAKRFVDGKNFFGGLLHVFYAPELESVTETRKKLNQRHRDIAFRIMRHKKDRTDLDTDKFEPVEQYHRKKKYPTLPLTEDRLMTQYPMKTLNTIYDGMPRNIDPRSIIVDRIGPNFQNQSRIQTTCGELIPSVPVGPRSVVHSNVTERKNYRGRLPGKAVKVVVVRPNIIDTKKIVAHADYIEKTVFPVVKNIENRITIKMLPKNDDRKKRIVMKNPSASLLVRPSDDLKASIKTVKSNIREAMKNN